MATKYVSSLTGEEMDAALIDMAYHNSEAYAVGTRNGVAVGSSDVTYHNNSKYWAEQVYGYTDRAEDAANRAEAAVPSGTAGAVFFDRVQTLTTAQQSQARANIMAGGSNRNLLDNPFFQVNQRSFTTSTGNTYTVDRWIKSGNATVTLSNGIIVFDASSATSSYNFFSQRLAQDFTGRTVTLSLMTDDGTIYSKSGEIPARASSAQTAISLTISTGVFLEFTVSASSAAYTASIDAVLRNGRGPLNIKAVKLELGSVSTLANDAPPDYYKELDRCKWYFQRIKAVDSPVYLGDGFSNGSGSYVNVKVNAHPMRTKPTVSRSGTIYVGQNAAGSNITTIGINGGAYDTGLFSVSVAATATANQPYRLVLDTSAYIDLSADI